MAVNYFVSRPGAAIVTCLSSDTKPTSDPDLTLLETDTGTVFKDAAGTWTATTVVPAGSSGQVQYNNGGAFAGASNLSYNSFTGGTTIGNAAFTDAVGVGIRAELINVDNPLGGNYARATLQGGDTESTITLNVNGTTNNYSFIIDSSGTMTWLGNNVWHAGNLLNIGTTAASARTALGLGTVAVYNVGVAGNTIPVLLNANTWSSTQTFAGVVVNGTTGDTIKLTGPTATGNNYLDFYDTTGNLGYIGWGSPANRNMTLFNVSGDLRFFVPALCVTINSTAAAFEIPITSIGAITSSSASGGVGYATGAGGSVTQITSKATGVTINRPCGSITTNNAALAAGAIVSFVVTNSVCGVNDTPNIALRSGPATVGTYRYWVSATAAGSFTVTIENRSAGSLSEALVFNFAILKSVVT